MGVEIMPDMDNSAELEGNRRIMSLMQDPKHEDTIRFLINPEKEIKDRMQVYAGYEYNPTTGKFFDTPNREPMLNERGLRFVKTEYNMVVNKFVPQSNLTAKQVEAFVMSYSSRVRKELVSNLREFGVKSRADLEQIKNNITDTAFFMLSQPIEDKGRKFIFSPLKTIENYTHEASETQPKKSRLGW